MLLVLVGPKEERFMIHKELICAKSKFFEAACSRRWKEGLEKTIRMPEVGPNLFQQYIAWIHINDLDIARVYINDKQSPDDQRMLLGLYMFGDIVDDIALRKKTLGLLVSLTNVWKKFYPSVSGVSWVYTGTPPGSPLRKLIVDKYIYCVNPDSFARYIDKFPAQFMKDIALAFMHKKSPHWNEVCETKLSEYLEAEIARSSERATSNCQDESGPDFPKNANVS